MNRIYETGEDIISFYACGKQPYHVLSNFAFIQEGIVYDGIKYYSTEHAFQAQKYIKEQRERFSVTGDLGNVDSGFKLVFGEIEYEKKQKYWMKKNNIGIIAKTATNEKNQRKLGLIRDVNFVSTYELWHDILMLKFSIPVFLNILKSTNNSYLLEFDRGGKLKCSKGNIPKWGGLIDNGTLYGENKMGIYLMNIRNTLFP